MVDTATMLREQIYSAVRAFTCATVGDILHLGRHRMMAIPGCGPVTIRDIATAVSPYGYRF